jgi:uncharacterized membrane protein YjgN (DUF898 family)
MANLPDRTDDQRRVDHGGQSGHFYLAESGHFYLGITGEHRIECNMSPWGLVWIGVSNLALTVVTLGLFIPWAMVRLAKFQLEAVRLVPAGNLQEFVAAEPDKISAVGEETATAFDFDISL